MQSGSVNGVNFRSQRLDAALFVGFAGVQRVQLTLDRDQFAVAAVILGKQRTVLGVLIQQPQMQRRVRQTLAVMLAVNGEQPAEISRTTAAVAGIPFTRQLPLPSALISRYKSRSSLAS